MQASSVMPTTIEMIDDSAVMRVSWKEGPDTDIPFPELRRFCACSRCRARGTVGVALLTDETRVVNAQVMGSAGLQIVFADGHDRGIYPWGYLRAIADGRGLEHLNEIA